MTYPYVLICPGYGGYMRRRWLLRMAKNWPRIRAGLPPLPHALHLEMAHVAQWFHAASDTTRLSILEFLSQRERSVSELAQIVSAPQSTISYHLKVLNESGLVDEHPHGRHTYYSLRGDTLENMIVFTRSVGPGAHKGTCPLTCCTPPLTYQ